RSIVVMSDGEANRQCSVQGTGNAKQDAIQSACDAYNDYGIKVYSVGFGSDTDEATLQAISSCGKGSYYYGNVEDLVDVYREIAQEIISASYIEQTVVAENIRTKLFADSYILIDYTQEIPYGLVISAESPEFGNTISEGSFYIPNNTNIYEVKVTSYSGSKWTDKVEVHNESSSNWQSVFDLADYNSEYVELGDPYIVNIPIDKVNYGNNSVRVSTALKPGNSTGGSPYDKIIYTLVKEISGYSQIVSTAEGCRWVLEFEDSSNSTINIPADYSGTKICYYTSNNLAYNNNDAIDLAIFRLLSSLDLNSNRKIETKFSENDLVLTSTEVDGIPFTWDTEVQVRVWR
ncbi:MAG: vWA domain-containing protein, partial [Candidatus Pacearchaeota archaeon]